MRWRATLFLLLACSDDATPASKEDARVDSTRGKVDAASSAPAPDAAFDAAWERDAARDAEVDASHRRLVESCEECSVFEQCWEPLCVKSPGPCSPSCEYVEPTCNLPCRAPYVCAYDGTDCDDAGACRAHTECHRGVPSCDDCPDDQACKSYHTTDGISYNVCVVD